MIRELSRLAPDTLIISGLAYGIDIIAHRAALEFGLPTVAVLGHGLNTIYPSAHRETARQMLSRGALVSDFHTQMGPERNNFLRRNRIIAGMSPATLVVESPMKGGALITAELAHSYNREVLAVPGRVNDPGSSGCNNLIKKNMALMVRGTGDLLHALNWDTGGSHMEPATLPLSMRPEELEIIRVIREQEGAMPETIGRFCGMDIPQVLVCLLEMELKGWIASEAGNRYRALLPLPGSG
jgi:DNA processing protein